MIVFPDGSVLGPRTSALRHLRGLVVTIDELLTDLSEWGCWANRGPLEHRPPEFWIDSVHDAVGGAE